jgi:formylglycine-generating enzyme required for sulfatase activity
MKTKQFFKKITVAAALMFGTALTTNANNVQISGTAVTGSVVSFNISWDNSWNASIAPANWDAVWVFIKYQDCATKLWNHASLSTNPADHTAGAPMQADPVSDGKGVFIRRSALGGGSTGSIAVSLKMMIPAGTYNYKVYGVEMVNVPQGNFELGDGVSASTFNNYTVTATSQSGGITPALLGGASAGVPSTYPVGYNAFYCMKYEITQEQYVEFLNSLTYDQQKSRVIADPISAAGTYAFANASGNGIIVGTSGLNNTVPAIFACDVTTGVPNNSNDGQNVPCGFLNAADVNAYLDWAALRPMTEIEFEKVCRGPLTRVAGEYAWGTTAITLVYSGIAGLSNFYTATESYTPASNGLCVYGINNTAYRPLRAGIFATNSSGRASAGAGYYGAMELSGNLFEQVVSTNNAQGVAFTGNVGDGALSLTGDANQATWPANTGLGMALRGGSYADATANQVRTSDRTFGTYTNAVRYATFGGRGVR